MPPPSLISWILIGGGAGRLLATAFLYRRRRRRAVRRFARLRRTGAYRQLARINPLFIEWIERLALFNARSRYARLVSFAVAAALIAAGVVGLVRN